QHEAAFTVLFRDVELVLRLDVEGAVLLGQKLMRAFAAGEGLHELERVRRVIDTREDGWLKDKWEKLALRRVPAHLRRRQREFLLDADGLHDGFGQRRFSRAGG